MYSRVNYTIVGIFVLLFAAGLIGFTFWLAKYGIHHEDTLYKLQMKESVSGLSKDSTVRLRGVDIGRVSKIRIDPENIEQIEVFLKIRSDVPIKEDMIAHTAMLGITGLLAIEIDGGTNASKQLVAKGNEIPVIPTAPSWFSKASKGLGNMTENLGKLLEKAEILFSSKNIETVSSILDNTNRFTAKAVDTLDEFNVTMGAYKKSVEELNQNVYNATKDFSKITNNTVPALNAMRKATENFNRLTLKTEKSLHRGDYNIKEIFEPMLIDIGILTEQLTDLSRALKENPNSLLFKSRKNRRGPGE